MQHNFNFNLNLTWHNLFFILNDSVDLMSLRSLRLITLQAAIESSKIFLLQYWNNGQLGNTKIIAHFGMHPYLFAYSVDLSKVDLTIEKQFPRRIMNNAKWLLYQLPFYATKIINHFLNSRISAKLDKRAEGLSVNGEILVPIIVSLL